MQRSEGEEKDLDSGIEVGHWGVDLEHMIPDATLVFQEFAIPNVNDEQTIVVLDTNILLLPYDIGSSSFSKVAKQYEKLKKADRIFIPSRVAREFIMHREKKLATIVQNINNQKSKINISVPTMPVILKEDEKAKKLYDIGLKIAAIKKDMDDILDTISKEIRSWRGNDPASSVYHKVFDKENIVSDPFSNSDEMKLAWEKRLRARIPPGYRDGAKADSGIGDYMIWASILSLAEDKKKNVIFVTAEEKSDWFVRMGKEPMYPRVELIMEFKQKCPGLNIHICNLSELLSLLEVESSVVKEVERAEERFLSSLLLDNSEKYDWQKFHNILSRKISRERMSLELHWDGPYGRMEVLCEGEDQSVVISDIGEEFDLRFVPGRGGFIFARSNGVGTLRIAKVENIVPGKEINFDDLDATRRALMLTVGDVFLLKRETGSVIAVRILGLRREPAGDVVDFDYVTSLSGRIRLVSQ